MICFELARHPLCALGEMYLNLNGVPDSMIQKMGPWSSNVWLQYLHGQILCWPVALWPIWQPKCSTSICGLQPRRLITGSKVPWAQSVCAKYAATSCESPHPSSLLPGVVIYRLCILLLIFHPPNPLPPPSMGGGGIRMVNHSDPGMFEDELGLQRCVAQCIWTMPATPPDIKRTRSSLVVAGVVVDHVWSTRSHCCLARISERL